MERLNRKGGARAARLTTAALALGVACGLWIAPAAAGEPDSSTHAQLTGAWKYNEKHSDNLQKKMEALRGGGPGGERSGRGGPRMGGGMGGGMGGPGGGRGRIGGDTPPGSDGESGAAGPRGPRMPFMGRPPMDLVIETTDAAVVLSERGLPIQTLAWKGEASAAASTGDADAPTLPAKWSGRQLVAETSNSRGGKTLETLELSPDGKVLTITLHLEGGERRPAMDLKRVYDRNDGE